MKSHGDHMISHAAVYEDDQTGARAEVILIASTSDISTRPTATDSGYYSDIIGRHGNLGTSKWERDCVASNLSNDSGHHENEGSEEFILGTLSVPPEISWISMDNKVEQIVAVRL